MTPVITSPRPSFIPPAARSEMKWVAGLLLVGFVLCFAAIKGFRANGHEPRFYQENFGPAVMMACGHGFTAPTFGASPPGLSAFLLRQRNEFSCAELPTPMPSEVVTWNGTWYYLYGTTSLVWRVVGITWTSLDALAAWLGAVSLAALYGLFRLVTRRMFATIAAFAILLSPANLEQLPMLRDYSKAPFVLLSVLLLGWLVMRPLTAKGTAALSALFGAVVGFGYGFRSDLIVMVPFGAAVLLLFLPGRLRDEWRRNVAAAVAAVLAFVVVGYPPLKGQETGGCQFHYSLLGLTSPLVRAMNVDTPIYGFGDHFLDTFVDLKVGDYANRVDRDPVPNLCAPAYDTASAGLFFNLAQTFPADLVVHAYGSVLTILRAGFTLPRVERLLGEVPVFSAVASPIDRVMGAIGSLGPLITAAAVGAAWAAAPRLGLALTAFVLFLGGYPAIEFESRHWFHLRFIPLWAAFALAGAWLSSAAGSRAAAIKRGAVAVTALVVLLGGALGVVRLMQRGPASALIETYVAAPVEPLRFTRMGESSHLVDWQPLDYGPPPGHRSSDMLVVTVSSTGCGAPGPVDLRFRYDTDGPGHDMSTTMLVQRGAAGGPPTPVFFPVFSQGHLDHSYLRFVAIDTPGRPADCITSVARFADRHQLPLWIQAQAPPDWRSYRLYQGLLAPGVLRF